MLLGLGAVEHLKELISHEDPIVRRNAIMVLGIMASNSKSLNFLIFFNVYECGHQIIDGSCEKVLY